MVFNIYNFPFYRGVQLFEAGHFAESFPFFLEAAQQGHLYAPHYLKYLIDNKHAVAPQEKDKREFLEEIFENLPKFPEKVQGQAWVKASSEILKFRSKSEEKGKKNKKTKQPDIKPKDLQTIFGLSERGAVNATLYLCEYFENLEVLHPLSRADQSAFIQVKRKMFLVVDLAYINKFLQRGSSDPAKFFKCIEGVIGSENFALGIKAFQEELKLIKNLPSSALVAGYQQAGQLEKELMSLSKQLENLNASMQAQSFWSFREELWALKAAVQGCAELQFDYVKGAQGDPSKVETYVSWLHVAARNKHALSQVFLMSHYYSGDLRQYIQQDYAQAKKLIDVLIQNREMNATFIPSYLGDAYSTNAQYYREGLNGCSIDPRQVVQNLQEAKRLGSVLGNFYYAEHVYAVDKDLESAEKLFQDTIALLERTQKNLGKGSVYDDFYFRSHYFLAKIRLSLGAELNENFAKVIDHLYHAIALPEARIFLSTLKYRGHGITPDPEGAFVEIYKQAEQGSPYAALTLVNLFVFETLEAHHKAQLTLIQLEEFLRLALNTGRDFENKFLTAAKFYIEHIKTRSGFEVGLQYLRTLTVGDRKDPEALYKLGEIFELGYEVFEAGKVVLLQRPCLETAIDYYRQAADLGHSPSMIKYGFYSFNGVPGRYKPNLVSALEYLERAYQVEPSPSLALNLTTLLWNHPDFLKSSILQKRVFELLCYAEKNAKDSSVIFQRLGTAHVMGYGTPPNMDLGLFYYNKAIVCIKINATSGPDFHEGIRAAFNYVMVKLAQLCGSSCEYAPAVFQDMLEKINLPAGQGSAQACLIQAMLMLVLGDGKRPKILEAAAILERSLMVKSHTSSSYVLQILKTGLLKGLRKGEILKVAYTTLLNLGDISVLNQKFHWGLRDWVGEALPLVAAGNHKASKGEDSQEVKSKQEKILTRLNFLKNPENIRELMGNEFNDLMKEAKQLFHLNLSIQTSGYNTLYTLYPMASNQALVSSTGRPLLFSSQSDSAGGPRPIIHNEHAEHGWKRNNPDLGMAGARQAFIREVLVAIQNQLLRKVTPVTPAETRMVTYSKHNSLR